MSVFFWNDNLEKYERKEDKSAKKRLKENRDKREKLNDNKKIYSINMLRDRCFQNALDAGWHTDLGTGELIERNKAEMLMLIVSEVAEAMEGVRKDLKDDHLPERSMEEVELADTVIRIMDYAGRWGLDIGGAIIEKLEYNKNRADHKIENRKLDGGKKF